mmetsp:Transcript_35881/g.119993  ORF Transcript_35881/g.119993 Transcript_35881/m.119993 type:complete len:224 (-) Transcript_35881:497-1168(-)
MTVTVLESQLPLVDAPPSSSSPLRSGSSRRSILVADRATCDLHVIGLDGRLRVWSQHEATLRCVRTLAPAIVPPQLAANPGAFWRHPSRTQAQLVADASGGSVAAPLLPLPLMRDPLELLAPTTPGEGRLMAVVGAAGVGVLALPADGTPGRRAAAASSASADWSVWERRLGRGWDGAARWLVACRARLYRGRRAASCARAACCCRRRRLLGAGHLAALVHLP